MTKSADFVYQTFHMILSARLGVWIIEGHFV